MNMKLWRDARLHLVVALAVMVSGFFAGDASVFAAGLLFGTTSSARLANGTIVQAAIGSPTSFVTVNNANNVQFMDGTSEEVETTDLTSDWKEFLLGLPDGGSVTFDLNTNLDDVGQAALRSAQVNRTKGQFKIILPGGSTPNVLFEGYVKKFNANATVNNPLKTNVEIRVTGPVTIS